MEKIINILIRRDHISENETRNLLNNCMLGIEQTIASGQYLEAEDIFMEEIGLEPDYLMSLLEVCI